MKHIIFLLTSFFIYQTVHSQTPTLSDSCKLNIGTNLGGLVDWGTEIPFVDLMRCSRIWYTKSIGDPLDPWDSEFANELELRPDGYPTHLPQTVPGSPYPQKAATIWGITDAWPAGEYTLLWEGEGELLLNGPYQNLQQTDAHRIIFDYPITNEASFEILIESSELADPIRNIRLLMPGTEFTYETRPFYQLWVDKVDLFQTVRFMDWGQTNNWGDHEVLDGSMVDWSERSQMDYYTWANSKGVPYEMMVKFMNDYDKDGWVCIPHVASEDYIRNMAQYFRDNLESGRHIYVEYSNETWNWMFNQTHWLNYHGCEVPGVMWPEGIVPYIQNMLNYWTEEFDGQLDRTTRVVGIQTGWLDVAQRVAFNLDSTSFDAISPTYYFGYSEPFEAELDNLNNTATIADAAYYARQSMDEYFNNIAEIKTGLADSLNKPIMFYEGGQHLTPHPFGVEPTYSEALLGLQRDTSMYNMYNEWFDRIRTLQVGTEPLLLMNFAFVGQRSAQFGSWGILETMDQDFSVVPAPKYQALVENMNTNCINPVTELQLKVFLQGPFDETTNLMNDNLRQNNDIPLMEPFTSLGFTHVNGGGEITDPTILSTTGNDAIVDWIFIELRDSNNPTSIIATQSALLQRDGDIVNTDGISAVRFETALPSFFITVQHRNHHGVRSLNSFSSNESIALDFTSPSTLVYGTTPMENIGGTMVLFSGDANNDGQINAVDKNNFWRIENGNPYNYLNSKADFNMDGIVNPVDKNSHWRINNSTIEQVD